MILDINNLQDLLVMSSFIYKNDGLTEFNFFNQVVWKLDEITNTWKLCTLMESYFIEKMNKYI